jgi:kinesin family protein 13
MVGGACLVIWILHLYCFVLTGKNDGSVKGVRYFKCRKRHGVFVRHDKLIMDKKRRNSGKMKPGSPNLRKSTGNLAAAAASEPTRQESNGNGGAPIPSFMKPTAASARRK